MFDTNDCVECGHTCETSLDEDIGGCANGSCLPYWSECYTEQDLQQAGLVSCGQVCASEGRVCDPVGCMNNVWMQWGGIDSCNSGNFSALGIVAFCDTEIAWENAHIRCCCSQ